MSKSKKHHPSDSTEQKEAERVLVDLLSREVGMKLSEQVLQLEDCQVKLDAMGQDGDRIVIGEAFARLSKLKAGQKRKILTDAFKLAFVTEHLRKNHAGQNPKVEAYLVFASENVSATLKGEAWASGAIKAFGLEIRHYSLPAELEQKVTTAEQRQGSRFKDQDSSGIGGAE
jgi:hypothetical protein